MKYDNKELGLFGFDLDDQESVDFLVSKGLNVDEIRLSFLKEKYEVAISDYIDTVAKDHGYDSAISFATYASGSDHYALEAQKFITFRSAVWDYAFEQFEKHSNGEIELPTISFFISTLPKFEVDI